jgi:cell division protein FtsW
MAFTLKKLFKGDMIIWMIILLLSVISLLAVYSSVGNLAYVFMDGDTWHYLSRHFLFLCIGFFTIFIVHRIPVDIYSRFSSSLLFLSILLLILTLLFGTSKNEATRWLTVPGIGISFQTSDFAKFALLIFVARILAINQKSKEGLKTAFFVILIVSGFICLLIFFDNLSTAALLFVIISIMMYIGRVELRYILLMIGGLIIAGSFIILISFLSPETGRFGTWKKRIETYVNGEGSGNYQAERAKMAIVNGGYFGKGPGKGIQRNFLPQSYSDFIYSIIIEEYGMLGGIIVLFLYLVLLHRTGLIISKCKKAFPALLATGLSLSLVIQAVVNMAVAVNLIPVTGQPLPLVSMGGTSVLFTCFALGILLSISRKVEAIEQINMQTAQA